MNRFLSKKSKILVDNRSLPSRQELLLCGKQAQRIANRLRVQEECRYRVRFLTDSCCVSASMNV